MSEQTPDSPYFYFTTPEGELEATPENASLFMFLGNLSSRNHVFISSDDPENPTMGRYVFDLGGDWFDRVANYMLNNGYTAHVNLHEVPECDEDAYQNIIDQHVQQDQAPDFIPDEWESGDETLD